jgi:integrase
MPVSEISQHSLLAVLENTMDKRGVRTAERVRQTAVQVFDHAIRKVKIERNVARLLKNWEDIPAKESQDPLNPNDIQTFLDAVDRYPGQLRTKLCIKLLLLTFVRKRELTNAPWSEFDIEARLWTIPASRMKAKAIHRVPLSEQAVIALRRLHDLAEGSSYVFPNLATADKPMSASTLNVAFTKMGYKGQFSPHGVRATASTWLNERGFRADVIERQLAHAERNAVRAAYNQADYLSERAGMMQAWADFVDPMLQLR